MSYMREWNNTEISMHAQAKQGKQLMSNADHHLAFFLHAIYIKNIQEAAPMMQPKESSIIEW